jgi:histidine triad (HIT) family protein
MTEHWGDVVTRVGRDPGAGRARGGGDGPALQVGTQRVAGIGRVADHVDPSDPCVFCGIVAGTVPCAKVAEDATTFAFMDIDPGSDGHVLVVPKRHSADLVAISDADLTATTLSARRIAVAMLPALGAGGINLLNCSGADAWQTVFHFHLHVIPRYRDRTKERMRLPFEPGRPADADAIAERARVLAALL